MRAMKQVVQRPSDQRVAGVKGIEKSAAHARVESMGIAEVAHRVDFPTTGWSPV